MPYGNTDGVCLCSALRSVGSVTWLQVYNYLNEPLTYVRNVRNMKYVCSKHPKNKGRRNAQKMQCTISSIDHRQNWWCRTECCKALYWLQHVVQATLPIRPDTQTYKHIHTVQENSSVLCNLTAI